MRERLRDLPGVRASFTTNGPGGRLELVLAGRDSEQLDLVSRELAAAVRALKGLGSVTTSASLLRPEIVILPDPARAADLGVSTVDIAEAARIATSGDFRQRLAKLNLAERQIPIRVQLADASLADGSVLRLLRVPGSQGPVPLSAVADIRESSGPARIDRLDRERNVTVGAELNGQPPRRGDRGSAEASRDEAAAARRHGAPGGRLGGLRRAVRRVRRSRCSPALPASTWCCCCSSTVRPSR